MRIGTRNRELDALIADEVPQYGDILVAKRDAVLAAVLKLALRRDYRAKVARARQGGELRDLRRRVYLVDRDLVNLFPVEAYKQSM